ncbi:MAG: radical SAM protein [Candidatus Nanoarchaeia archaeon]|nr:radical SAM protein [Candidatus Nanoarchaeia archaeon]MDD5741583.1 radical SAM protein [Candidatus Nanoarchaeia archaeon]
MKDEKTYNVYFRITDKCNLECKHCCYDCGPKGDSMLSSNIKKVVDNIPAGVKDFELTGGEPFVVKPLLYEALSYIQSKKFPKISVIVQTNGFWIKDEDSNYKILKELCDLGVNYIDFTSNDEFHKEQGIDINKLHMNVNILPSPLGKALDRLNDEFPGLENRYSKIGLHLRGAGKRVQPLGRAKSLPIEMIHPFYPCLANINFYGQHKDVTIDPQGNVYLCCWQGPRSIGSVIETPLEQLVEDAENDPITKAIIDGGPQKLAKQIGMVSCISGINDCITCQKIFAELDRRPKAMEAVK